MKLKVNELVQRQKRVIDALKLWGVAPESLYEWAYTMAKCKKDSKECFDYCDKFIVWAKSYSDARCKALNVTDPTVLVTDDSEESFIGKCILYGTIRDDSEIPASMKKFISYCQTTYDMFDSKDQEHFAKDFCKTMKLDIKPKDSKYWDTLVQNIDAYERGDHPEPRKRLSSIVSSMVDSVKNKFAEMEDAMLENDPEKYTAHYLAMILPESLEFYVGSTDLETANNFAKRHKANFSFPIGSDYAAVLVKQADHFLICERDGKVLWDRKCDSAEASAEYNKAYDIAAKSWNSVWVAEHSVYKERLPFKLSDIEGEEEEEPAEAEEDESTKEEEQELTEVVSESDYWLYLENGTIVTVYESREEVQEEVPIRTKEALQELVGTSNEEDINALIQQAEGWISSHTFSHPYPTDPYERVFCVIFVL